MTPERMADLQARAYREMTPWRAEDIAALLDDPLHICVADDGGFLLGRAVAGEAEILALATDPDRRRKGIARALTQGFLATAAQRGATRAFLEVARSNAGAIAFYTAMGFAEAGARRGYYRQADGTSVDALVMVRDIAADTPTRTADATAAGAKSG